MKSNGIKRSRGDEGRGIGTKDAGRRGQENRLRKAPLLAGRARQLRCFRLGIIIHSTGVTTDTVPDSDLPYSPKKGGDRL